MQDRDEVLDHTRTEHIAEVVACTRGWACAVTSNIPTETDRVLRDLMETTWMEVGTAYEMEERIAAVWGAGKMEHENNKDAK